MVKAPAHGAVGVAAGQGQARHAADVVSDQPLAPACVPQALVFMCHSNMLCPAQRALPLYGRRCEYAMGGGLPSETAQQCCLDATPWL